MILKLKDLEYISNQTVDYKALAKDSLPKRKFSFRLKYSRSKIKQMYLAVRAARALEIEDCKINPDSKVIPPRSIDNITFKAMMELQANLGGGANTDNLLELITEIIAISTYQANHEGLYISSGPKWDKWKATILNSPLEDMLGLYNYICAQVNQSQLDWEKRFLSVLVEDKVYDQAGGSRMNQFNVINTIKSLCADFNCTYDEAWQKSYALTQTNSYAKATANHIQDEMRQIREIQMKQQQKKNTHS